MSLNPHLWGSVAFFSGADQKLGSHSCPQPFSSFSASSCPLIENKHTRPIYTTRRSVCGRLRDTRRGRGVATRDRKLTSCWNSLQWVSHQKPISVAREITTLSIKSTISRPLPNFQPRLCENKGSNQNSASHVFFVWSEMTRNDMRWAPIPYQKKALANDLNLTDFFSVSYSFLGFYIFKDDYWCCFAKLIIYFCCVSYFKRVACL